MNKVTKRQLDVLRLVAQGLSNKDIATYLTITEATVKLHMHGLFKNLNVSNRTQALIVAQKMGLV